jgi:hypothetical protein
MYVDDIYILYITIESFSLRDFKDFITLLEISFVGVALCPGSQTDSSECISPFNHQTQSDRPKMPHQSKSPGT